MCRLSVRLAAILIVGFLLFGGLQPSHVGAHSLYGTSLSPQHSAKCMDVQWGGTGDRVPIWQWPCNGTGAQQVQITDMGGGWHQIRFVHSGKCLDVPNAGHDPGIQLWQYGCNGTDAQKFTVASSQGSKHTLVNKASNLCIDVSGGSTADQAAIIQNNCNGSVSQSWAFMPPYSRSWYISPYRTNQSSMTSLGANDGMFDAVNSADSMVVLDFGRPTWHSGYPYYGGYGTDAVPYDDWFVDDGTIAWAAAYYTDGWYPNSGNATLKLVIGSSNSHQCPKGSPCTPSQAGYYWGDVVNDVKNYVNSHGYGSRIMVWAGDDIEQSVPYDSPGPTRQFVDGFNNHDPAGARLIDYGTDWTGQNGWTSGDVYYVCWGGSHEYPLPELYTENAKNTWIGLKGSYTGIYYVGGMTECQNGDPLSADVLATCTTPSGQYVPRAAWYYFWYGLNAFGLGQTSLTYSTNIRWQQ
jgi:hypothetical protein